MKICCISDSVDVSVGLKLSGIDTKVIIEKEEIIKNIKEISSEKTIGILIVTQKIYNIAKEEIEKIKKEKKLPLIVTIPDEK